MAHFTYNSENHPDFAYKQSALTWHDSTTNALVLLAIETLAIRGVDQPDQRKSTMLQFDLESAETLLEELTKAVEAQRANSFTHTFTI